jgi:hypothetical protein
MISIAALRWITLASILFWLVVYWQGGEKVMIDIKESIRAKKSHLDMVLLIVMTFCSLILIATGVSRIQITCSVLPGSRALVKAPRQCPEYSLCLVQVAGYESTPLDVTRQDPLRR